MNCSNLICVAKFVFDALSLLIKNLYKTEPFCFLSHINVSPNEVQENVYINNIILLIL